MDLRELYQDLILDHSRKPRNFRTLPSARCAEGYNPLCGDRIKVFVNIEGNMVKDVCFQGAGCAICTASASLMTDAIRDKTEEQAHEIFESFHRLVTSEEPPKAEGIDLGKLSVFAGVREYPIRIKCATLAWHTLRAALDKETEAITTESTD